MAFKNGLRLPVGMSEAFPYGCHLLPDSIAEVQDYDERTKNRRPATDKVTGTRVWQCRVSDMDPALEGRSREVVVKILADQMPVPPTRSLFEAVEFEGLTVTPYVDSNRCNGHGNANGRCNARMAYSVRATGIKAARPAQHGKDAA
jgi:hypothetical protein